MTRIKCDGDLSPATERNGGGDCSNRSNGKWNGVSNGNSKSLAASGQFKRVRPLRVASVGQVLRSNGEASFLTVRDSSIPEAEKPEKIKNIVGFVFS